MPIVISRERLEKLKAYEALEEQCDLTQADIIAAIHDQQNQAPAVYQELFRADYQEHKYSGLLEDDGYDPALTAQENYQQERWNK